MRLTVSSLWIIVDDVCNTFNIMCATISLHNDCCLFICWQLPIYMRGQFYYVIKWEKIIKLITEYYSHWWINIRIHKLLLLPLVLISFFFYEQHTDNQTKIFSGTVWRSMLDIAIRIFPNDNQNYYQFFQFLGVSTVDMSK